MCYALLRVNYKNDKQTITVDCESQTHMESKIKETQSKPEVSRIGVFLCHRHIERIETWNETPYKPPSAEVLP